MISRTAVHKPQAESRFLSSASMRHACMSADERALNACKQESLRNLESPGNSGPNWHSLYSLLRLRRRAASPEANIGASLAHGVKGGGVK